MFRQVQLDHTLRGHLYLHSMPGHYEELSDFIAEARHSGIDVIVCLTSHDEIDAKSPYYAAAMEYGTFDFQVEYLPVPDFGVPPDREQYAACVRRMAGVLHRGRNILIHCAAGIGRTGTFAVCLLIALGMDKQIAEKAILHADSMPETDEQKAFIRWYCRHNTAMAIRDKFSFNLHE